jgi:2-dehydro-3-deoxyphosphogluconate aldolase / (4S)-4-hydroxy-2-oxoglutarate aldolase
MTLARSAGNFADPSSRREQLDKLLQSGRLVPVITIERAEDAVPLARALVAGGLRLLEITLRTPAAPEAAARIIAEVSEAVVGIGTVLTPDDLLRAEEIGAQYALSPGTTPDLLDAAAAGRLPFIPGIATASELIQAITRGFDTVKFFPAVPAGGIPALKALAGPFPQARFCPTGGIREDTAAAWLAQPNVVALGGSWLTPASDIRAGNWDAITGRARQALSHISQRH